MIHPVSTDSPSDSYKTRQAYFDASEMDMAEIGLHGAVWVDVSTKDMQDWF